LSRTAEQLRGSMSGSHPYPTQYARRQTRSELRQERNLGHVRNADIPSALRLPHFAAIFPMESGTLAPRATICLHITTTVLV